MFANKINNQNIQYLVGNISNICLRIFIGNYIAMYTLYKH